MMPNNGATKANTAKKFKKGASSDIPSHNQILMHMLFTRLNAKNLLKITKHSKTFKHPMKKNQI